MNKKEIIQELSARKVSDVDKSHQETNDWALGVRLQQGAHRSNRIIGR